MLLLKLKTKTEQNRNKCQTAKTIQGALLQSDLTQKFAIYSYIFIKNMVNSLKTVAFYH